MADSSKVTSGRFSLEVVHSPSTTLDAAYKSQLIAECCPIARAAFRNEGVRDEDIIKHAIDVSTSIFIRDSADKLIGFSSSVVTQVVNRDIVYLEGTVVHPDFQGQGLYAPIIALRVLLGLKTLNATSALVSTRISSPRILKTMVRRFGLYPKPDAAIPEELPPIAAAFADMVRVKHSDFTSSTFDLGHLVVKRAYGRIVNGQEVGFCMYGKTLPWCVDGKHHDPEDYLMDDFVRRHLNYSDGDAFLMIGSCDRAKVIRELQLTACEAGMNGDVLVGALEL